MSRSPPQPAALTSGLTIDGLIRSLFPRGYVDFAGYQALRERRPRTGRRRSPRGPGRNTVFDAPPCQAPDLFVIAATLVQRSGAYHHVTPAVGGSLSPRTILVTASDREAWKAAGAAWRGTEGSPLPPPPNLVNDLWNQLVQYGHRAVYKSADSLSKPRPWWKPALALLAIADEAAADIGFESGRVRSAQAAHVELPMREQIRSGEPVFTISSADRDQACVLPKSRTPRVGCTLRSLSHHLALLPPRGLARAYWTPYPELREGEDAPSAAKPFNLLVVPTPYRIRASAFKGTPSDDRGWGWFEVEPDWCPSSRETRRIDHGIDRFAGFVEALIASAEADVGDVHAVVLPETALSEAVFRRLCDRLKARPAFELLICGLFDTKPKGADDYRAGNFAAMARFASSSQGERTFDVSIREKHHRWRLDRAQIDAYALGSALDVNLGWWERIDILSRSLDMFVIRGAATVTTLICEDLARSDPCQELVRGVGPNLVVALLMDGPQLKDRWPARYATVLAEDPGSAVLTVSSYGLIHRGNEAAYHPPSHKVGLWRDDRRTAELTLPPGSQALCLTLQPSLLRERTLDGRLDSEKGEAQAWELSAIKPIRLADPDPDVVEGRWPSPAGGDPRRPQAPRRRPPSPARTEAPSPTRPPRARET